MKIRKKLSGFQGIFDYTPATLVEKDSTLIILQIISWKQLFFKTNLKHGNNQVAQKNDFK